MTSSSETSQEMDLESQETGRGIPAPRKFFRRVAWVLLAVRALSSKAHSDKKENRDSPRVPLLSPSHLNLEEAEIERISPEDEVSIDVPCNDEAGDAAIVEKISKGPAIPALGNVLRSAILVLRAGHIFFSKAHSDKKENHDSPRVPLLSPPHRVAEIEKLSPEDEVSIEVPCNDEAGNAASDIKQQHENIANILKERNLKSLHEFGGVKRVAEVLETDLENGITGDIEDLRQRSANAVYKTPVHAARNFLELLMKSGNTYTIFLLIVSAALSLGFGIKEEGLRTGWYEGVIIILAIIILVIERAVRDFLGENPENLLEEQRQRRKGEMEVDVIRAGKQLKVPALDLVIGDIVSLERGCPIPGDGLFVSGKDLKLDDSFQSDVNEQNPFLFYGSKVIEGQGNMLVTSMGLNTKLGEMISKASKSRRLPAQLDKVSNHTEIAGLATSILILVVLFLRFKLGKEKEDSGLPEFKGEHKTKEVMELIKRIVWKPSGKISALTPCLATFLVGVVGGVPFVTSLAIYYWNKKILSTKAIVQEQLTVVTMGSVTAICIDKTAWLTMNPQEVDERWIDDTVTREDSAIPEVKDKCSKETIDAVKACINAGVKIMLVSEDGESVIEDIAQKYGMLSGSGILGGETFRSFSDEQRKDVVNKICVMGKSLPSDKLLLVRCLKQQGHIVAFVGVRTGDAPSLKEADVGIVTGTGSSELVNGSSELIILDGNFGFLASILNGGRCINGNIHKYIQVEVTITISGLLISIVTTIIFGKAPLEAIQMIWVNLVVAVLGGLALLTEPPSQKLMEKPPVRPSEPFITKAMWRNIIIQASYQVSILLAFQFKGQAILNINEDVSKAMIFSSFLLCQLSNQFNASEQKLKNLVKGVQQNLWFWVASVLTVVLQVVFIEISHDIFGFARLNGPQWGICFLIGALSCVTDWAVNITWAVMKVKLRRSSSIAGSEHPQSTSIIELPLIAQNSSPTASY
ncbi:calcium-transporting ATPase 8, plasma membrane-type [Populus alba]|uniref:Uncharacterized protein n=1 Tax=Populus alba TaxID=43335 RepID=A0A4U5MPR0_POPAL|nr:calcium-transporting ATPase 8, plasma membrane-type-like [Populus alba]TKR70903.1 hypothetical protein D5086_0000306570 [Populus alba]